MGYSSVTKRRIRDANAGNVVTSEDMGECTLDELQARYSALCDSIVAAQSLDDLGPEMNEFMWNNMLNQQEESKLIEAEIRRRGEEPKWG